MPISPEALVRRIGELRQEFPMAGEFCFFTDLFTLKSIVDAGGLLPRNEVKRRGLRVNDCADPKIIQGTPNWVHDRVRLYHAPLTPMLFDVEGIKRHDNEWPECPQPFYLVFDPLVLTLPGVRLSNGNMASPQSDWYPVTMGTLNDLPFSDIYHRGSIPDDPEIKPRIVIRRHAEILIPDKLPLSFLTKLVFRSEAEKQLALQTCASEGLNVSIEVNPKWFNADRTKRPYIKSFEINSSGRIEPTIKFLDDNDEWISVTRIVGGKLIPRRLVYSGGSWRKRPLGKDFCVSHVPVNVGDVEYFFNGYRVAQTFGCKGTQTTM